MARTRPALVADASVIVKWFLSEEFSENAIRVKKAHDTLETKIVIPTLARYEILNALRYSNNFGTEELYRISQDLEDSQFLEQSIDGEFSQSTIKIASDFGLTIYDASYLAIGEVRKLDVFTADKKVLDKVGRLDFVHHIRDY